MHRATHAAIEPGITHEDLGKHTGQQKCLGRLTTGFADMARHQIEEPAVAVGFDDGCDLVRRHSTHGRQPLGDDFAMAAVRAENLVCGPEGHGTADGGGLLPDGQVRRPFIDIFDAAIGACRLEGVKHALELADHKHMPQGGAQPVLAPPPDLGREIALVGVHRNVGEAHHVSAVGLARIDRKLLRQN